MAGLLVAVPWRSWPSATSWVAAFGLGLLAGTDLERRRVPRRVVRWLAVALTGSLSASAIVHRDWQPAGRAATAGVLAGIVLGVLWWLAPNAFAFGDVKVSVIATAAAASVAWSASCVLWLVAGALGTVMVLAIRHRQRGGASRWLKRTIPFVPCLAVGFVLGVGVA